MKIFKINENSDFEELCKFINVSKIGLEIMKKKSKLNYFYIKDIKKVASNILKQDALSLGAELIVSKDSVFGGNALENVVLMGNDRQLELLSRKEQLQDFGLKKVANFLKSSFPKPKTPQLMGIININQDSFNEESRVDIKSGLARIEKMLEDGATYIDIGAVSSRPNSIYCGEDEEFARLEAFIKELYKEKLYEKAIFSLDTFNLKCTAFALKHGFKMINDISANFELLPLIKDYEASYCLMHMRGKPENMQKNTKYEDIFQELDEFFLKSLEEIYKNDVKNVFIDVGLGFGKSAKDNLLLLKHLEHFLHFGHPLLIGASRKSTINTYFPSEVKDRLAGTLYLHLQAFENGAEVLRVHDVYEHKQFFAMQKAMQELALW